MYRQTNYAYQNPAETDFLYAQRFMYEGLGLIAMDFLGTTALVAGLACTATGPASLNINIGPGRIYSLQTLEPTAWGQNASFGGLAVDTATDHEILKQGLFRDTTAFSCPAPGTSGQSVNYLIEASFSEVDAVPLSLNFVSSTPPYPSVAPQTLNTVRQDKCVITVKAGTPATTGSQTTPSPDASNLGLWVVTVANGQSTITAGNISVYNSANFINETLTQKISQTTADGRYVLLATTSPTYQKLTTSGNYTPSAGVKRIEVRMVGGGSGSSGSGTGVPAGNAGNGGDTIFNGIHAAGATGATASGNPGIGGTGGTGTAAYRAAGQPGNAGIPVSNGFGGSPNATGPSGASSLLGGAPPGDTAAAANSGAGGGAPSQSGALNAQTGASGASGEYVELLPITNPGTIAFTIGAGGTAGVAGASGQAGHAGGSGVIWVKEIYTLG